MSYIKQFCRKFESIAEADPLRVIESALQHCMEFDYTNVAEEMGYFTHI